MFDIVDVEKEWAVVCPVNAHTILHRSTEVVRPNAFQLTGWSPMQSFRQVSSGSFRPSTLTQSDSSCLGLGCVDPRCSPQTN